MASPTSRPKKPVHLRLACDACTTAKVRCSKTYPCERCMNNGQVCFYSASRRHGKRSQIKKTQPGSTPRLPIAAPGHITAPSTVAAASFGSDFMSYSPEFTSTSDGTDASPWSMSYQSSPPCHSLTRFSSSDIPFNLDDASSALLAESWKTADYIFDPGHLRLSDTPPSTGETCLPNAPRAAPAMKPATTAAGEPPDRLKSTHNCESLALNILTSLHHDAGVGVAPIRCCKEPLDAGDDGVPTMHVSATPSIDIVLSANKAALAKLDPLLKCPCVRNPHIALLYSTILSKTIFWYQVAVSARCHASATRRCDPEESVTLSPMKIQLGILDLDDDDQAMLQQAVLLRELHKAEKIMETFHARSANEESPEWHASAIQSMKEGLQAVIQKTSKAWGGERP